MIKSAFMVQRFVAWWIRNAAYIGPVASCVSALAAMVAVLLTTRSLVQTRRDKREDREAEHPKFVLNGGLVLTEGHPEDYYSLSLMLINIAKNSAQDVKLVGLIKHHLSDELKLKFEREPAEEIHNDLPLKIFITESRELDLHPKPYHLELHLAYKDARTGKEYGQVFRRKFYIQADPNDELRSTMPLLNVDVPEYNELKALGVSS